MKNDEKQPAAPLKRIGEIIGDQSYEGNLFKIPEILNTDLVITGFKDAEGDNGKYYILTAHKMDSEDEFGISCGSKVVMKQVDKVNAANGFPCVAMFKKQKKYYILQ